MFPSCSKWWLAGLLAMQLLSGCAGLPMRDADEGNAESSLPADYQKALALMRSGHYRPAIPVLRKFSETNADLAGPHINLGIAYRQVGDNDAALRALDRAIAINATSPAAHMHRGIVLREQGEFEAAQAAYIQALELQPDYALAHLNIGILHDLYLQQSDRALTHYRHYLELTSEPDKAVEGWIIDLQRRSGSTQARITP